MNETNPFHVDRTALAITSFAEAEADDIAYWQSKTPIERLDALELMRQVIYGYDPATARLQRFFEIAERS